MAADPLDDPRGRALANAAAWAEIGLAPAASDTAIEGMPKNVPSAGATHGPRIEDVLAQVGPAVDARYHETRACRAGASPSARLTQSAGVPSTAWMPVLDLLGAQRMLQGQGLRAGAHLAVGSHDVRPRPAPLPPRPARECREHTHHHRWSAGSEVMRHRNENAPATAGARQLRRGIGRDGADLNRRPPAPQAGALPGCATSRVVRTRLFIIPVEESQYFAQLLAHLLRAPRGCDRPSTRRRARRLRAAASRPARSSRPRGASWPRRW